ncbi:uncharacterized protein T551_03514 [Pneumocystis jirovecii RU7]|uniref:Phospho-2-dehydro-3-deoxyheptonate aldolase n=1 Tax=Pneumocystis jirovecii (strain RU7) TaxID=1408657 RepID=A0A0W4ZE22_PNEJ7|nr:uncharacterized protein T551_03514 [Pneumocystis jirovecii RU7]KTW26597.1 hypothetical protein T551_03514 [Pneumocystis jirovecii RU7]
MQKILENTENYWEPSSWKSKPIQQRVIYENQEALETSLNKLRSLPPLVHFEEILLLKKRLKDVALHKSFLLQGGDCAESFSACTPDLINSKLKVILQMSIILILGINIPVVTIARMAGQYAKPRSKLTEMVDKKEVLSFRGESVNGCSIHERQPNPERLLTAYFHSSTTLNYIRLLSSNASGLYTLIDSNVSLENNNIESGSSTNTQNTQFLNSLNFKKTNGMDNNLLLQKPYIFTSHEGLLLDYEESMTRKIKDSETNETKWWNLGAHFLWIGDRTRSIDGAHVEYFRGIENPIGVKIGPTMKPDELVKLLDILDPKRETGKVTLIFRYGYDKIKKYLPQHIKAVQSSNHKTIFISDPMHGISSLFCCNAQLHLGNTLFSTEYPHLKTRDFSHILLELKLCFDICKASGSHLDGVHFEMTGEDVTECLGGSMQLQDKDLSRAYKTLCDPRQLLTIPPLCLTVYRLNYSQSLEMAFLIVKLWCKNHAFLSA